jgi:hypothetical protein
MRGVALGPVRLTWFACIVLHPDCNMWMATGSKKKVWNSGPTALKIIYILIP